MTQVAGLTDVPRRSATVKQVADGFDVAEKTVRQWAKDGCPHDGGGSSATPYAFDQTEVAAWMRMGGKTGKPGRPVQKGGEGRSEADLRRLNAMADHWELKNAALRRQVILAVDVDTEWGHIMQVVRNGIQNLGATILPLALQHGMPNAEAVKFQNGVDTITGDILRHLSRDGDADGEIGAEAGVGEAVPA